MVVTLFNFASVILSKTGTAAAEKMLTFPDKVNFWT